MCVDGRKARRRHSNKLQEAGLLVCPKFQMNAPQSMGAIRKGRWGIELGIWLSKLRKAQDFNSAFLLAQWEERVSSFPEHKSAYTLRNRPSAVHIVEGEWRFGYCKLLNKEDKADALQHSAGSIYPSMLHMDTASAEQRPSWNKCRSNSLLEDHRS